MIIPLTSTTVATNGVDETAGSKPKRDNMKGSIAPIMLPNKTKDINDAIIVFNKCMENYKSKKKMKTKDLHQLNY